MRLRPPNFAILIEKEQEFLLYFSLMAKIIANKNINKRYLTNYLNSSLAQKTLARKIFSKSIPMLQIKELSNLEIIFIDKKKQQTLNKLLEQ